MLCQLRVSLWVTVLMNSWFHEPLIQYTVAALVYVSGYSHQLVDSSKRGHNESAILFAKFSFSYWKCDLIYGIVSLTSDI